MLVIARMRLNNATAAPPPHANPHQITHTLHHRVGILRLRRAAVERDRPRRRTPRRPHARGLGRDARGRRALRGRLAPGRRVREYARDQYVTYCTTRPGRCPWRAAYSAGAYKTRPTDNDARLYVPHALARCL
jgi:hypothetical protein